MSHRTHQLVQPIGLLYLRPHAVVAGSIMFNSRSFFLSFFLSPKDLRDGATDREPFQLRRSDIGVIL